MKQPKGQTQRQQCGGHRTESQQWHKVCASSCPIVCLRQLFAPIGPVCLAALERFLQKKRHRLLHFFSCAFFDVQCIAWNTAQQKYYPPAYGDVLLNSLSKNDKNNNNKNGHCTPIPKKKQQKKQQHRRQLPAVATTTLNHLSTRRFGIISCPEPLNFASPARSTPSRE